jgi:hypothetical protein
MNDMVISKTIKCKDFNEVLATLKANSTIGDMICDCDDPKNRSIGWFVQSSGVQVVINMQGIKDLLRRPGFEGALNRTLLSSDEGRKMIFLALRDAVREWAKEKLSGE